MINGLDRITSRIDSRIDSRIGSILSRNGSSAQLLFCFQNFLEALVLQKPALLHLGEKGASLLTRWVM